jgi:hypothetical protein
MEDLNESGRRKFQEREFEIEKAKKELQRKVEEGEQARYDTRPCHQPFSNLCRHFLEQLEKR